MPVTRILSDIHYGDRSSQVLALGQLRPLVEGIDALILNGDTMDTRTGPSPERTQRQKEEVLAFFGGLGIPVTYLTGNHDPDFSSVHRMELAGGKVFLTHGDLLFRDVVPWSRDRATIYQSLETAFSAFPAHVRPDLDQRLTIYRQVAAAIPQRHQSERNALRYLWKFMQDTVWPPTRALAILKAWRDTPALAFALAEEFRPEARFALLGHTHRPGIWENAQGRVVINTGSYATFLGGYAVDLDAQSLAVYKIRRQGRDFALGRLLRRFSLA